MIPTVRYSIQQNPLYLQAEKHQHFQEINTFIINKINYEKVNHFHYDDLYSTSASRL